MLFWANFSSFSQSDIIFGLFEYLWKIINQQLIFVQQFYTRRIQSDCQSPIHVVFTFEEIIFQTWCVIELLAHELLYEFTHVVVI